MNRAAGTTAAPLVLPRAPRPATGSTLTAYLAWRGDLPLAEHPFNLVDNLVLSALAYLDLADVVPAPGSGPAVTVGEAAARAATPAPNVVARDDRRLTVVEPELLQAMARSARFREARLSGYVDLVDPGAGTQFAALTIDLGDGTRQVVFRGTDNTIVGWREDFTMSVTTVPAQRLAASYLDERARECATPLRVGGHSKGGNLAAFAAMAASPEVQDRLIAIHNNDGPGLNPGVRDDEAWARVSDRVVKIVPGLTIVGTMFEPAHLEPVVVRSSATGLRQHDLTTWQVVGAELDTLPALPEPSRLIHRSFQSWMQDATTEERADFTNAFFDALEAGGANLITEVASGRYGSLESVLFDLGRRRGNLARMLRLAARSVRRTLAPHTLGYLLRGPGLVRGALVAVLGVFLVMAPTLGLPVLGAFALTVAFGAGTVRGVRLLHRRRRLTRTRAIGAAVVALIGVLIAFALAQPLTLPTSLLLGLGLLVHAGYTGRRALVAYDAPDRAPILVGLLAVLAVVSMLFGIVTLTTAAQSLPFLVQQCGQFLIVAGLIDVVLRLRDRAAAAYPPLAAHAAA